MQQLIGLTFRTNNRFSLHYLLVLMSFLFVVTSSISKEQVHHLDGPKMDFRTFFMQAYILVQSNYSNEISRETKQGKKVFKATATRCAFCFRLLASRESDRAKRLMKKSYSTQLLTAAGRCKKASTHGPPRNQENC